MGRNPSSRPRTLVALSGALFAAALLGSATEAGTAFVAIASTLGALVLVGAVVRSGDDPSAAGETGGEASEREGGSAAAEGEDGSADGGHSVWDAIPSWQYTGRHVESGGLTRDEQERALSDVEQQAEELDRNR